MDHRLTPRGKDAARQLAGRLESPHASGQASQADAAWDVDRRSPAERDRDRVLYSSAFRRLAYVTQVTAPEAGHVFHNRLSHSLKVAQVGRRNAERLRALAATGEMDTAAAALVQTIDPSAVEASCLAHDLGHPPFGHITEAVLRDCGSERIGDDGAFEGNAQSFRIVTRLAQRAGGSGLNLTRQTLDGILKYPWGWVRDDPLDRRDIKWGFYKADKAAYDFTRSHSPQPSSDRELPELSVEALIMEWADDLTYAVHDLDDFFRAGVIPLHRLAASGDDETKKLKGLLEEAKAADPKRWRHDIDAVLATIAAIAGRHAPSGAYEHTREHRRRMRRFDSDLITRYMSAFHVEDEEGGKKVRVVVDDGIEREVEALKTLVQVYVIRRPGLAIVQHGQQRVIQELFEVYFKASDAGPKGDRRIFPPGPRMVLERGSNDAAERTRTVIDFIAGLTEQTALDLHRRLCGSASTVLDATAHMA